MTSIFVGNLPYEVTDEDLQIAFGQYGAVEKVNVVCSRDSRQPRGFAFVEMTDSAEAANAINALNGQKLLGRTITVNEARPRAEREEGSGYGQRSNRGGNQW
jgi:cold-inducible RNA-binding protein